MLNGMLSYCVFQQPGFKLMSPYRLADSAQNGVTIHVTVNSLFFGFIDDLYILSQPYGYIGRERVLTI